MLSTKLDKPEDGQNELINDVTASAKKSRTTRNKVMGKGDDDKSLPENYSSAPMESSTSDITSIETNDLNEAKTNTTSSIRSKTRRSLSAGPFPAMLWDLLISGKHSDIVSWGPDDLGIIIHKPRKFIRELWPSRFKPPRQYAVVIRDTFVRQLNIYRFRYDLLPGDTIAITRQQRFEGNNHPVYYVHDLWSPHILKTRERAINTLLSLKVRKNLTTSPGPQAELYRRYIADLRENKGSASELPLPKFLEQPAKKVSQTKKKRSSSDQNNSESYYFRRMNGKNPDSSPSTIDEVGSNNETTKSTSSFGRRLAARRSVKRAAESLVSTDTSDSEEGQHFLNESWNSSSIHNDDQWSRLKRQNSKHQTFQTSLEQQDDIESEQPLVSSKGRILKRQRNMSDWSGCAMDADDNEAARILHNAADTENERAIAAAAMASMMHQTNSINSMNHSFQSHTTVPAPGILNPMPLGAVMNPQQFHQINMSQATMLPHFATNTLLTQIPPFPGAHGINGAGMKDDTSRPLSNIQTAYPVAGPQKTTDINDIKHSLDGLTALSNAIQAQHVSNTLTQTGTECVQSYAASTSSISQTANSTGTQVKTENNGILRTPIVTSVSQIEPDTQAVTENGNLASEQIQEQIQEHTNGIVSNQKVELPSSNPVYEIKSTTDNQIDINHTSTNVSSVSTAISTDHLSSSIVSTSCSLANSLSNSNAVPTMANTNTIRPLGTNLQQPSTLTDNALNSYTWMQRTNALPMQEFFHNQQIVSSALNEIQQLIQCTPFSSPVEHVILSAMSRLIHITHYQTQVNSFLYNMTLKVQVPESSQNTSTSTSKSTSSDLPKSHSLDVSNASTSESIKQATAQKD